MYKERKERERKKLAPSLRAFLHRSPFLFHVVTGTTMYILSARPLMLLHSQSRLKPEEKREGEKDAGEIVCCALSLARHLTSPGKRQIRFRLLSRQSKLQVFFFLFRFLSLSRFLCLCFISVDAVL